ncbi:coproporphyrinogen III oxidase [Hazenella coriacea]|uniref:Oxygen-independent coproporphyrinogen-3 oxidase n=1 Tax=Hazenella coriacea TaxID=1179467 RepID=A0A4R3L1B4_9BACL|nr:coproporphyrinogen III oxidase [Hazenella coriacea]TCS93149.1 oxygen-independent coproporphyrinogen-3 oxidase [Hazenella coriacea]
MKKIQVTGISPDYFRDIEHIVGLFFEDVKVTKEVSETDIYLHVEVTKGNPIRVEVTFTDRCSGGVWKATDERNVEQGISEKKMLKRTVKHACLQLFQDLTGIVQPWGILTGIRPTKLVHRLLLEGKTQEEVKQTFVHHYKVLPDKIELLHEIVQRQMTALPDLYHLDREVSLYIGIPFCPTKCAYCTFPAYAIQGRTGSVEQFLTGLHEEIAAIGSWLDQHQIPVTTIYLGGGTPTSISVKQMEALFVQLKASISSWNQVRELTVEAGRPDTLDEAKLQLLRAWGVDRISINPQSFKEETLKLIGRHHTVKETLETYRLARQMGLHNINMDLIIGLPNEGVDEFSQSLDMMEQLRPESLTVHTLSFKRGSLMSQQKDRFKVSDRTETAQMVRMAREWAKKMNYVPYYLYRQKNILGNQENVGYALPGEESLYNILIMEERQSIIGLGCGAVSKIISPITGGFKRWPNPKEPQAYIQTYQHHINEKIKELNLAFGFTSLS